MIQRCKWKFSLSEQTKLKVTGLMMLCGITLAVSATALGSYGWAAAGSLVFAAGVFWFD